MELYLKSKGKIVQYTTKELLRKGGILGRNGIFRIKIGNTINYYREVDDNLWVNYHCSSAEY